MILQDLRGLFGFGVSKTTTAQTTAAQTTAAEAASATA
jgi:hypothetical protein